MDILFDPVAMDAVFVNGTAPVVTDYAGVVEQRLILRIASFLGEWWMDTTYGIPYTQQVFGKIKNKANVDAIFQSQILTVDGVQSILSYSSTLDSSTRTYSAQFSVLTTAGTPTGIITI